MAYAFENATLMLQGPYLKYRLLVCLYRCVYYSRYNWLFYLPRAPSNQEEDGARKAQLVEFLRSWQVITLPQEITVVTSDEHNRHTVGSKVVICLTGWGWVKSRCRIWTRSPWSMKVVPSFLALGSCSCALRSPCTKVVFVSLRQFPLCMWGWVCHGWKLRLQLLFSLEWRTN